MRGQHAFLGKNLITWKPIVTKKFRRSGLQLDVPANHVYSWPDSVPQTVLQVVTSIQIYSPISSTSIFANSNNGRTLFLNIFGACLLPPYGFTNTNNCLGRSRSIEQYRIYTILRVTQLKLGGIEISIPVMVFLKYRGIPKYHLNHLRKCVWPTLNAVLTPNNPKTQGKI